MVLEREQEEQETEWENPGVGKKTSRKSWIPIALTAAAAGLCTAVVLFWRTGNPVRREAVTQGQENNGQIRETVTEAAEDDGSWLAEAEARAMEEAAKENAAVEESPAPPVRQ